MASQNQLSSVKKATPDVLTTGFGQPINDKINSLTYNDSLGRNSCLETVVLQDAVLIDELAHFDRERIPERVVHAKGAGAFGYFEVTSSEIQKHCKAHVFGEVGRKTRVAVRFSTVGGEQGSADTVRDPRGFAMKFYTEEGNWDLVGNNTPVFFIRDPMMFPTFIHTQKRNPATHLKDPNAMWDFWGLVPESTHQVTILMSDRGIPDGYRHMNGYGSHTFKLVNKDGQPIYCKFHVKTNQGIKCLHAEAAHKMAADNPDYSIKDLYDSIASGNHPSWRVCVQLMTYEQAKKHGDDPFDVTKVWPHKDYPLIEVGKMVLNENPTNYFLQVEQMAFTPANMVPGIEPSPDKMLQGRLFSYGDTHRYRLGGNHNQIPVNRSLAPCNNYQRDGFMCTYNQEMYSFISTDGAPNYFPNSFNGPQHAPSKYAHQKYQLSGDVDRHGHEHYDNFKQPGALFDKVMSEDERERTVRNIAATMKGVLPEIQDRAIANFEKASANFGKRVRAAVLAGRK